MFFKHWNPLHDVERDARSARREAEGNAEHLAEVEERVDQLSLFCMALWSLLKEHTSLGEEDLAERIEQLDLSKSKEQEARRCAQCDRVLSVRHQRCLYCGHRGTKE